MVVLMALPVDILDRYLGLEMRVRVYRCKMVWKVPTYASFYRTQRFFV